VIHSKVNEIDQIVISLQSLAMDFLNNLDGPINLSSAFIQTTTAHKINLVSQSA